MKKIIIPLSFITIFGLNYAEYTIKLPLEQDKGGNLPNGTININTMTELEEWILSTPYFTEWTSVNSQYDCTNWEPQPNTIPNGQNFIQTATDCKQDQTRSRQEREQETTTLTYRDIGSPTIENQTITASNTRNSIGTLENWVATTPTYTSWVNSGVIYGCSNWSPDPSSVNSGVSFTQTATDCEQDQTRNRQDREQETTTLTIRNNGASIVENQTLINQTNTRSTTGTKAVEECRFDNPYGYPTNISYYWVVEENVNSATNDPTMLYWYNAALNTSYPLYHQSWENMPKNLTTLNHAGYKYTRGPLWGDDGVSIFYTICRVPL